MRRCSTGMFALAIGLIATTGCVRAAEDAKYPNWKGQWAQILTPGVGGQNVRFDPTKAFGPAQQAPLTPEYQTVHEASMADQAQGGLGNYPTARCLPGGMMTAAQEYVIMPEATYIIIGGGEDHIRRVFTDGRDWPADVEPTYQGYSIGRWIDEDGDGQYDILLVETRGPFKGPRAYDATGLPLAFDNQSIFEERFHLDKSNPNILHDEITVIDHALWRPWSVDKTYRRNPNPRPIWRETSCTEGNNQIVIGKENYFLSGDGLLACCSRCPTAERHCVACHHRMHLMPAKKNQAPPDLRYFKPAQAAKYAPKPG